MRAPKIQRLVTPERLRRKKLLIKRSKERKQKRDSERKQYDRVLKKKEKLNLKNKIN